MFSLHHPVVVLGSGQLVGQSVAFLPVRVEIVNPSALEITNFAAERLQLVMNSQNMFPEVTGVGKTLVTLVTHLLLDLHVELLDVVLHGVFPLEQLAALIAGYGRRGVGDHVSVEVPLTAQIEPAQVTPVGPVSVHLFHVSLQYLDVFESFTTDLALNLLAVPRHQHLVRVPQVFLVGFLPYDHH